MANNSSPAPSPRGDSRQKLVTPLGVDLITLDKNPAVESNRILFIVQVASDADGSFTISLPGGGGPLSW